jgi:hypothetical protein
MHGPVALFGVGEIPARITRKQLLAASQVAQSSSDWSVRTDSGTLMLRFRQHHERGLSALS